MEAQEHHDPGYDDWFDEPEPPTETQSGVNRGVYEEAEEVWVLPEDEDARSPGQRELVIAGRTLTMTQVAILALSLLAIFFAILAAAGVFNGSKTAVFIVDLQGADMIRVIAESFFMIWAKVEFHTAMGSG